MDDPFEVAVEHVAWCIRQRLTPVEVLAAIGVQLRRGERPTWRVVTWALAREWEQELAGDRRPRDIVAPFRDPKPKRRIYA